jgi:hypothetical protein
MKGESSVKENTLYDVNGKPEALDSSAAGEMPEGALALKAGSASGGPRWITDPAELAQLQSDNEQLAYVIPAAEPADAPRANVISGGETLATMESADGTPRRTVISGGETL